tara:strand:+ start:615 stop:1640 length:1026 start_codon:yes stop_codon:yes gene_type:complete
MNAKTLLVLLSIIICLIAISITYVKAVQNRNKPCVIGKQNIFKCSISRIIGKTIAEFLGLSYNAESFKNNEQKPVQRLKAKNPYDSFYAPVYSTLISDQIIDRTKFEIKDLIEQTDLTDYNSANLLDIGCGGSDHLKWLANEDIETLTLNGIDKSEAMLLETKNRLGEEAQNVRLIKKDIQNNDLFMRSSFSHITSYYFTLYYIYNDRFMKNIKKWLKPKGWFVVHVVDLEKFDPILDAASPFLGINPQKYVKNRITESKVTFKKFIYFSNFSLTKNNAYFDEAFHLKNRPTIRTQRHTLKNIDINTFVDKMGQHNLLLKHSTNLSTIGYHYQYILYFQKV